MKKILWFVIGLMLASLVLSACGSSDESGFPTGKFVNPNSDIGAGIEFNTDGTWKAFNSGYTLARGTYSVEGDLYIEESNNGNCPTPMKYKYTFDGANLKFDLTDQSKNDSCGERKMGFDGVTYVLSK
jgi:major membrane immunogen (membrane-anchored lipoprotein)